MARPKKIVEAQQVEVANVQQEEVKETPKAQVTKTVSMVRDETYPDPRTADVHPDEIENWKLFGWTIK